MLINKLNSIFFDNFEFLNSYRLFVFILNIGFFDNIPYLLTPSLYMVVYPEQMHSFFE